MTRVMSTKLAGSGILLVDAPISGGPAGAKAGTLTAMLGGDQEVVHRVLPYISLFCKNVTHVGPVGSGHALKVSLTYLKRHIHWACFRDCGRNLAGDLGTWSKIG